MQYTIIEDLHYERLEKRVEELLNDGWHLHGNLLMIPNPFANTPLQEDRTPAVYAQALINENDPQESVDEDSKTLVKLLGISPEQLPPNTAEIQKQLADFLTQSLAAKKSDTDSK